MVDNIKEPLAVTSLILEIMGMHDVFTHFKATYPPSLIMVIAIMPKLLVIQLLVKCVSFISVVITYLSVCVISFSSSRKLVNHPMEMN